MLTPPHSLTAEILWKRLCEVGVTHVVGLPDTQTGPIFARQATDASTPPGPGPRVINVCREGETFGIAAGLWAGGAWPVILLQSTGLFESGDALRSFSHELEIPLDLLIGWRGHSGKLNAGWPDTARDLIIPTLDAWRLPYEVVLDPELDDLSAGLTRRVRRERGTQAYLLPQ